MRSGFWIAAAAAGLFIAMLGQPAAAGNVDWRDSSRSGRVIVPPGAKSFTRKVDGRRVVYVTPDVDSATPTPLLLVLNYKGGNPGTMANLAYAGEHAAKGEYFAFPESSGWAWNNGEQLNGNPQRDLRFLADVIADAVANANVDPARIAISGYSSGGFMANLFACERPDLVIGLGMVAAAQLKSDDAICQPRSNFKAVFFNGTSDDVVRYNGTYHVHSAPETLALWEGYLGCSGPEHQSQLPVQVKDRTSVAMTQISGCPAQLYTINKGGHTWPGGMDSPLSLSRTTQNIDATETLWQAFFGGS